jgi:cell fate (sporulation/competence/biofilm development) regulator YmcA (YheA/YmcA/DUF963 family)
MEINDALDDLIDTIKKSDIYQKYCHILYQVEHNKDINKVVADIKKLQQKIVKEEYLKNKLKDDLEQDLEKKKTYLYSIPLYQDHIEASSELNNLLKNVTAKLQTYLNELDI